jgi:hypothetical protein
VLRAARWPAEIGHEDSEPIEGESIAIVEDLKRNELGFPLARSALLGRDTGRSHLAAPAGPTGPSLGASFLMALRVFASSAVEQFVDVRTPFASEVVVKLSQRTS